MTQTPFPACWEYRILHEHRADDTAISQVFSGRRLNADGSHEIGGFLEHWRRTNLYASVHVDALADRTLHVTNSRDAAVLDVLAAMDDGPRPRLAN